jgi:hypothetical protein
LNCLAEAFALSASLLASCGVALVDCGLADCNGLAGCVGLAGRVGLADCELVGCKFAG